MEPQSRRSERAATLAPGARRRDRLSQPSREVSSRSRAGPTCTGGCIRWRARQRARRRAAGAPCRVPGPPRRPPEGFLAAEAGSDLQRLAADLAEAREDADEELGVGDRLADLERRVPRSEQMQVLLVEVCDRLRVVADREFLVLGTSSTQARTTSPTSWRRASRPTDSAMTRIASCGSMKHVASRLQGSEGVVTVMTEVSVWTALFRRRALLRTPPCAQRSVGASVDRMRGLLALTAAVILAGSVALADASTSTRTAHRAGSHAPSQVQARTPLSASVSARPLEELKGVATCSAGGDCAQGCALAVAQRLQSPHSPTAPCASQTVTACTEYVAAQAAKATLSSCSAAPQLERNGAPSLRLRDLTPRLRTLLPTLRALRRPPSGSGARSGAHPHAHNR